MIPGVNMCIHWRIIPISPEGEREAVVANVAWRGTSLETQNAKPDQLPAHSRTKDENTTKRGDVHEISADNFAFSVQSDIRDIPTIDIELGGIQLEEYPLTLVPLAMSSPGRHGKC